MNTKTGFNMKEIKIDHDRTMRFWYELHFLIYENVELRTERIGR